MLEKREKMLGNLKMKIWDAVEYPQDEIQQDVRGENCSTTQT